MFDVKNLFERQAQWQLSRAKLSWTKKLQLAEILREAALAIGSKQKRSELPPRREAGDRPHHRSPTKI